MGTLRAPGWLRLRERAAADPGGGRARLFAETAQHDFTHAGGFLVLGALAAASLNVLVPRAWLDALAENPALAVLVLAVLAVVLAICSEADAFVAASLTSFSLTARLVFLVVGPVVDVKLVALQAGTFGPRFALRFAPVTFVVAVGIALLVAWVLL
ncbi:permease [Blastococcus sp. SYSU DS0510]